jgi:hypothetical protein
MRLLLIFSAVIAISIQTHGKKLAGSIIANGQTRDVTFDIKVTVFADEPNFEAIQYKVRYYDENGKKQTLRPEDADEIYFQYYGMFVRMISLPNTISHKRMFLKSSKIFLKLEVDGPLRLYRFYYKQTMPGSGGYGGGGAPAMTFSVDDAIFQKGNGPLKQPKDFGWKKDMLEYFSDCPALTKMIESKDLKRGDIEAIAMFYNRNCGK